MNTNPSSWREKIILHLANFLAVEGLISLFFHVEFDSVRKIAFAIVSLLLYGLVFYYIIHGYRKPNGKLMKCIILCFALSLFHNYNDFSSIVRSWFSPVSEYVSFSGHDFMRKAYGELALFVAAVFLGYMAGRLHKVKNNIPILILVGVALLIRLFLANYGWYLYSSDLSLWITISTIYLMRYRLHGEEWLKDGE